MRIQSVFAAALVTTLVIALVGCASITTRDEAASTARGAVPDAPFDWAAVQQSVGDVQVGWIDAFNDPLLNQLVREAQANNIDLRAAAANVDRSVALARQAGAALKPQVNLLAGGAEAGVLDSPQGATSSGTVNTSLQIDWEADIWGRIRAGQQAAVASAEAARADYTFSQYSLAAGVARGYFVAVESGQQEVVAQQTVDTLTETVRIVQAQYDNGSASSQDLALAKSDLASAEDTLTTAAGGKRDALRALEILLGRYPSADVAVRKELPAIPAPPPAGVPSAILERRPDIIAAERTVAAAFNSLDAAKAARLPSLSLTADIGGSSEELSNLFDPVNVAWTLASNLLAPLYDGGQRQAQVEVSTAEQQQAVAAYASAAQNAFAEVEGALDSGVVLQNRVASLQQAADQAAGAYRIAALRYEEGEIALIDVLSVQQRVFTTRSNLVNVQRQLLEQRVILNLALGGDWAT
ncbi:MAG: efflux transporter outer membrane subunit [Pseudomonadota bacterium]